MVLLYAHDLSVYQAGVCLCCKPSAYYNAAMSLLYAWKTFSYAFTIPTIPFCRLEEVGRQTMPMRKAPTCMLPATMRWHMHKLGVALIEQKYLSGWEDRKN